MRWQSTQHTKQICIKFNHLIPKDFDYKFYIDTYPDLQASGIDDEQKAKEHFLFFGITENRIYNNKNIENIENENFKDFHFNFSNLNKKIDLDFELNNFKRIIEIKNKNNNILNKFFDAIFVINLESDFKRKKNILSLEDNDISYFYVNAISYKNKNIKNFCDSVIQKAPAEITKTYDYNYVAVSLCLTNILILNFCIQNNINSFLILEDDFLLHLNFYELFKKHIQELPSDWNILWLGHKQGPLALKEYNKNWFLPNSYTWGTHAYAIKNCSELIREEFQKFNSPIDVMLTNRLNNLKKYVSKEQLIISVCDDKKIGPDKITETYNLWGWKPEKYNFNTKKTINFFDNGIHPGSWLNGVNGLGAWGTFCKILESINNKNSNKVFFDFIDREFGWRIFDDLNKIQELSNNRFLGILHHPYILPDYLYGESKKIIENINNNDLIKNFNIIFTLSNYLNLKLKKDRNIKENKIKIETIFHPSNMFDEVVGFSMDRFKKNKQKNLISLGGAFRKLNSIDKLNTKKYKKAWMFGDSPTYLKNLQLECQLENYFLSKETHLYKEVNFNDYNEILSSNIMFLDFVESSANNAVLECIARSTPMVIKKHPSVVEYLGEEYPLYFNNLDDCKKLLVQSRIKDAHQYLKNMDKNKFNFYCCFRNIYKML
jgi:GR25 family glycosyltransferase involved in LPS biosynthesis